VKIVQEVFAMRGMISIFAELEKSALALKLRAARQRAQANRKDYREGRKPFGARPERAGDNCQNPRSENKGAGV
jgi:hypothetical protein